MILINENEKRAILKRYPQTYFVRTMKHDSKRHHYYVEDRPRIVRIIDSLRGISRKNEWRSNYRA